MENDPDALFIELSEFVGIHLQAWRRTQDYTQQTAATVLGFPLRQYQRLEQCTANPELKTLARLGAAMGLSVSKLLSNPAPGFWNTAKGLPRRGKVKLKKKSGK
jgi:transcriptional regulator with XRE-family HTH domain